MSATALSWTCLLLMVAQAPQATQQVVPLNTRSLKIGIRLDAQRRADIRDMFLYVSPDQGRTWQQEAVASPNDEAFVFHAPKDGEYWFKAVAVNKQGKQDPKDVYKGPVDQKVLIDTLPPTARIISVQRQGEDALVNWEVQDNFPQGIGIKLEYQAAPATETSPWTEAPIAQQLRGQARVRVNLPGPVAFRLQAWDQAGNVVKTIAEAPGLVGEVVTRTNHQNSAPPPPVGPEGNTPPAPVGSVQPPPPAPVDYQHPSPPAPPSAHETQLAPVVRAPFAHGGPPTPAPLDAPPAHTGGSPPASWAGAAPLPAARSIHSHQIGTNATMPALGHQVNRKPLPPVQLVNSPAVVLEFELARVGPAGLKSVEFWVSHNDGEKWAQMAEDPAAKTMKGGKYQRTVEFPGEGVYGLTMVVRNAAGRGKPAPRDGDVPEMRIEVDLTKPEGELYPTQPDPQRPGALLITWSARDKNLAANPIALEWAERPEGPWQTIHANLPNNGRYTWQLPSGLPVYVHLRMRVRDAAGNEAFILLPQEQLTDLSEPEGRLVGVAPLRLE